MNPLHVKFGLTGIIMCLLSIPFENLPLWLTGAALFWMAYEDDKNSIL